ncbi:MAG: IS66 family transposase [Nevskia sp.]|nr:IS66 family transposase [Nevskia sp.]
MTDLTAVPAGIDARDWANTPAAIRVRFVALSEEHAALSARVAALEERVGKSSRNSSLPPSSDMPRAASRRTKRQPSGRRSGGQPGHEGHGRMLLASAQVDAVVEVRPLACAVCGVLLLGEDPAPGRHQVTDIPPVRPRVTEYRRHTLRCQACGHATTAPWPAEMPTGDFGPRVAATVAVLRGRLALSQRETQEALNTLCGLEVGLGSISAVQDAVSAALAAPVAAALTHVQAQPVVNADETSWREQTKRCWLWVATTALVTVFLLRPRRSSAVAKELLGAAFGGIVGSDRYSGYAYLAATQRAVCWAHLTRDFQSLVDRGGESAVLGTKLLAIKDGVFVRWQQVREDTLARAEFVRAVAPLQTALHDLLAAGTDLATKRTSALCKNLLKLEPALWTFVTVPGVEPTNNAAERALRRPVLWRRRSFGTQSAAGSLFVERVLTAVTTLRQQGRDVLDYLTGACAAATLGAPAPSLLPLAPPAALFDRRDLPVAA